ncbi:MAG: signal recognition particle-docking protein FtsY [Desertifilum sp. SIO1I2]|nr:signal recognition particle-docking protein FtsY [Desertifilum sp. SIO1I2]
MVFNWFRRQFNRSEESAEEQQIEEQEATSVESPSDAEQETEQSASDETAMDYLAWAKAAYQNIQTQQAVPVAEPPEVSEPEAATPEVSELEVSEPEAATPEVSEPEAATPEVSEPEVATPEAATPEVSEPEVSEPEAATPEVSEPEVSQPEVSEPEVREPEAVTPEVSEPEVSQPEVNEPEAVTPEVSEPEAIVEPPQVEEAPSESEEESPTSSTPPEPSTGDEIASTPVLAAETTAEAPAPAMSFLERARAERQGRIEALEENAIAEPEPDVQATSAPVEVPGIAFDEGFIWSAEVLAAQGRRPEDVSIEEITWLKRLRQGLDKTRRSLINQLRSIVGQGPLNQEAVLEIEALLLQADVGVEATDEIIRRLQNKLREETLPPEQAIAYLKSILRDMLDRPGGQAYDPLFIPEKDRLNIWLITGVNGAGKTTTIGKLAHISQKSGYRTLIAAADTFRAAAVEQVKVWGQRSGTEAIANPGKNTDPAAVVFDAIAAAQSRNTELLLVDTAGRLQNKKNLMEELSKIRRIIDKKAPEAHVESLLVLDATLGQNGLRQAEVFSQAAKLSGVVLTKLDGTAKGGVALAVVQQLGLPIRFIGAGEGIEDLRPFSSYEFVEALISG